MQKTLKPTYFMKEMHEYDFKSFSKMIEFNLDLSKQDYDTFCPQKSINEYILYQNQGTYSLEWPNQNHTQFHV